MQQLTSLVVAAAAIYSLLPLLRHCWTCHPLTDPPCPSLSVHPVTKEPYDGVIAKIMREFSAQQNDQPKWMVLDGDIDAEWIESMNTVMDDNKCAPALTLPPRCLHPHACRHPLLPPPFCTTYAVFSWW